VGSILEENNSYEENNKYKKAQVTGWYKKKYPFYSKKTKYQINK